MLGGAVGVAVLTSILIAFLRKALPDNTTVIGGEMLMDLFHSVNASALNAHGASVREAAESAFRNLFIICATISAISPLLMWRLQEKELRGKVHSEAASE
jgi:hypothetical protein